MLNATRALVLPTTITGSYPRPHRFTEELRGRGFKDARLPPPIPAGPSRAEPRGPAGARVIQTR